MAAQPVPALLRRVGIPPEPIAAQLASGFLQAANRTPALRCAGDHAGGQSGRRSPRALREVRVVPGFGDPLSPSRSNARQHRAGSGAARALVGPGGSDELRGTR